MLRLLQFIKTCAWVFYFLFPLVNNAQKSNNNSVVIDTNLIKQINKKALGFQQEQQHDSALYYFTKALNLSKEINNIYFQTSSYLKIGRLYQSEDSMNASNASLLKALKLAQQINSLFYLPKCYANLGLNAAKSANFPQALGYFYKALKIEKERGDDVATSYSLNNIGMVYKNQKNYALALKLYKESVAICVKNRNEDELLAPLSNIGSVFYEDKQLDSALYYQSIVLKKLEMINDKERIGGAYLNIGLTYDAFHKYDEALFNYVKAESAFIKLDDEYGLSLVYMNTAAVYSTLKNLRLAKTNYLKSLAISLKIDDIDGARLCYGGLAAVEAEGKNYQLAYQYQVKFKQLTDSIFNSENSQQIGDLKTNFEVEKKEAELKIKSDAEKEKIVAVAEEREKKQTISIIAVVFVLFVVLVFSFFLLRRYKITQKQKLIIEIKEKETQFQKEIIQEKQKEILDSIHYAKRIQNTLIANKAFIDENIANNFVFLKPRDIVSGDFYWATKKNNKFYLAVCDSTGHGVPGAFMSLLNFTFLNEAINEKNIFNVAEVFNYVRQKLIENLSKDGQKDGFDGILICIDNNSKEISYAAANNSPVLISEGIIQKLPCDKMPVGEGPREASFTLNKVELKPDDTLYLYTDGFADQFGGEKGKKFKYKELNNLLLLNSTKDFETQAELLKQKFDEWKGNLEQVDDVCIAAIKIA
ncbi:MAG: tetratricopeptide repeat protein [Burkholderiales bacterium]|nr:tetratricopeptide repeat protein [Bacteroidia bacterium]